MDINMIRELNAPLFEGIDVGELDKLLKCMGVYVLQKEKGDILLHEHSETTNVGVLLIGELRATQLDPSGKQLIISHHSAGSTYGDILSFSPSQKSPVTVTALTDVTVMLIPIEGILRRCHKCCVCHDKLINNMLRVVSQKYFKLQERLTCIMRPSLREKLLFYFERVAAKECRRTFSIPFDRAALAEYLNAERSALSRELSAMKHDGIIDYHKSTFRLMHHAKGDI
jgi:CRP-like cAMP-binding protein